MRLLFNNNATTVLSVLYLNNRVLAYFFPILLLSVLATPSVFGQVQGKVYRDFNANGVFDSTATYKEVGLSGVTVTAYNSAGTSVGTTTTNATGNYTIPSVSGALRVEFTVPTYYFASKGSTGNTPTQFVTAPTTTTHLALNVPADYSATTNPNLATPCYINGNPILNGSAASGSAFVGFPYNATGDVTPPTHKYSNADSIGSTWGVAYKRSTQTLYTSAFLKRHVGLGPLGIGGIYKVSGTSTTPAATRFVDVKTIGIDVGTVATNSARGLPINAEDPSHDPTTFDQIGKVGMGDMDITDDDKKLFLVNLFDKKLYSIIIDSDNNPSTAPTAADVTAFTIPTPNCTNGVARPWAIKIYRGKVYVGLVCTAENAGGAVNDMFAYIYALDMATGIFNPTPVFSFPLNYPKLPVEAPDGAGWQSWTADYMAFAFTNEGARDRVIRPQPIFADIEFDIDGSMILSFIDRAGHQYGFLNYSPDITSTALYNAEVGGDILRVANVNGVFQLEHNGTAGSVTGAETNNNGGPGTLSGNSYTAPYGEFYDDLTPATVHNDCTQGGSALLAGSGQVIGCFMDPIHWTSGGIMTWSNSTGQQTNGYELYASDNNVATFGKANGLGDLELLLAAQPLEIGNRVWTDTDKDGYQDAGETGISGLTVDLYEGTTKVGTTTTDANGNYYFASSNVNLNGVSGLKPDSTYQIRIGTAQGPLSNLTLTTANVNSNGSDLIDNDATTSGSNAIINVTLGSAGENNHTLDFGFHCIEPTITSTAIDTAVCTNGVMASNAKIAVRGIVNGASFSYGTNGTTGLFANTATTLTADSIQLTGIANPSVSTTYTFRIWASDTLCYNDTTVTLTPSVCPPCSLSATFTQGNCQNNNTTAITTDDYFTVSITAVSATNGGTSGKYEVILNGTTVLNAGGTAYGTPITVGGAGVFGSDGVMTYSLKIRDLDISGCETTVFTTSTSAACSTIPCPPQICLPVIVTRSN